MSTEKQSRKSLFILLLPLVTALPAIAALTFLALRYGHTIHKLINIVIKMAVKA